MAASIPTPLKSADIARFVQRAGQVEKAKPVLAYWCNYWIVNQILSKGLHNTDDECMTYTMNLMDKLEQTKNDHAQDDAIIDDTAGQAYVEQFGEETLQRAENAMRANKASRQTADTLQAAATFLDLCQIWGPLEPEVASKIKFAKYHALRIARAIKAGEDPNLSNPTPEPVPNNRPSALDPNDPDVQMLNGPPSAPYSQSHAYQPSVEEVPDEHDRLERHMAQRSSIDESIHPSRATSNQRQPSQNTRDQPGMPSPQNPGEEYYHHAAGGEVSPLASPKIDRTVSDGGGYFPRISDPDDSPPVPALPDAPPQDAEVPPGLGSPDPYTFSPPPLPMSDPRPSHLPQNGTLESFPPPHVEQVIGPAGPQAPSPRYPPNPRFTSRQMPTHPSVRRDQPPANQPQPYPTPDGHARPAISQPTNSKVNNVADEEAVLNAQKHARWAISALNFEDVNTAVKELRGALEALGAR